VNPPRLIAHAGVAAIYWALFLTLALRLLHPAPAAADWWVAMLPVVGVYTLVAALLGPLLYGLVRFFASHRVQVPPFSLRYVMSFFAAGGPLILISVSATLWRARRAIDPLAAWRIKFLLAAGVMAWLYALIICVVPGLKRRAGWQASAAGLALAVLLAPGLAPKDGAVPIDALGEGAIEMRPPEARLILVEIDGADLEDILKLMARGRLPGLARLRHEGAMGRLQSVAPCTTAVARTTLVTGRYPYRDGVRGAWTRDLLRRPVALSVVPEGMLFDEVLRPFMRRHSLTVDDRRAPAVWDILAQAGGTTLTAGFDADLDRPDGIDARPAGLHRDRATSGRGEGGTGIQEFFDGAPPREDAAAAGLRAADLERALAADARVLREFDGAEAQRGPGVTALSLPGIDIVGHQFLRYARPGDFGNVSNREVEAYGDVLGKYFVRLDAVVERALRLRGPRDWLFVVSAHGMRPASLRRRILAAAGGEPFSGSHDGAPAGFLFALGPEVRPGVSFGSMSIVDVVPTALYLLDLPIARELDGSIIEQILVPGDTRQHPAVVIDSYGLR
jgi:hypothetical protein